MAESIKKYRGGNIWEAPSFLRSMISLSGDRECKIMLVSDPKEQGSMVSVEENGKWLYTPEELRERLANWKWIGTHHDYIEQLCKEALVGIT